MNQVIDSLLPLYKRAVVSNEIMIIGTSLPSTQAQSMMKIASSPSAPYPFEGYSVE